MVIIDNVTLIGVIGSVVSILSFFYALFSSSNKININSNNKTNYSNSFNSNSFNNITTNYNIYNHENYDNSRHRGNYTNKENTDSDNLIAFLFLGAAVLGVILKLYLSYQDKIISWIIIVGIIGLLLNLIAIAILQKVTFIPKIYLYINTIRWFPLFILLIFIYHPIYTSKTITDTKNLIASGAGFFNILGKYNSDVLFLSFQILGLVLVMFLILFFVFHSIHDLYRVTRKYKTLEDNSSNQIIGYIIFLSMAFVLVSGLYIKIIFLFPQSIKL